MCGAGIPRRWRTGAGEIFLLKELNHGMTRKPDPLMNSPHTGTFLLSVFALASATVVAAADLPTPDEYRGNWPRFRVSAVPTAAASRKPARRWPST